MNAATKPPPAGDASRRNATSDFLDVEPFVREAMHMTSIAATLAHAALGEMGKPDGEYELVRMLPQEHERLLFAIDAARDFAEKASRAFLAAADTVAAP